MKKVIGAALVAAAFAASASAEVKFSGYVRAGWSMNIDSLNVNEKEDHSDSTTATWLAGDYFGAGTRSRLNFSWVNENGTAGVDARLQYSGKAEGWTIGDVKYAAAYVKPFDGNLTFAAGKLKDAYFTSDGWEGFSVIDGKSGFTAAFTPTFNDSLKGLAIGGGAVVDYLDDYSVTVDGTTTSYHKSAKDAVYFGGKYSNGTFNVASQFGLEGYFFANAGVNLADSGLNVQVEFARQAGDALANDRTGYGVDNTVVLWAEYTGIDKLTAGLVSYVNIADVNDSTAVVATVTPAVRYDVNDDIALSLEGTLKFTPVWDKDKIGAEADDAYATIVPAVYLKAGSNAELNVWGKISTDTDQDHHAVGTGVIFNF